MVRVDLERALLLAELAAPVRWDEVTGSTNATAMELAEAGTAEWTLVGADHQTQGRGRQGRSWVDQPGQTLMVSVVLRPALAVADAGVLTILAGAAWAEAGTAATGLQVRCKWPNDLLIDGRKMGGILAESAVGPGGALSHVVIGSGINVAAPAAIPDSTGLGETTDPTELLASFLRRFHEGYGSQGAGVKGLSLHRTLDRWRTASDTLGRRVRAHRVDGQWIEGIAVDIDERASLIVETADGVSRVAFGEIEHLR